MRNAAYAVRGRLVRVGLVAGFLAGPLVGVGVVSGCGGSAAPAGTPSQAKADPGKAGDPAPTGAATPTDPTTPVSPDTVAPPKDDGVIAQLRTGAVAPEAIPEQRGTIVHSAIGDDELYEIELDAPARAGLMPFRATITDEPTAQVVVREDAGRVRLFVRRSIPKKIETTSISGSVWYSEWGDRGKLWRVAPFVANGSAKRDAELPQRFVDAWSSELRAEGHTPFHHFAAGRIHTALLGRAPAPGAVVAEARARETSGDLSQLMYTTTAATSFQEALQYEKGLGVSVEAGRRDIDIASIAGPALADHPFDAMLAGLKFEGAPTAEPMAANVPGDFWYLRFDDIRDMLRVLDEAGAWMTPVVHAMEERPLVRDLAERYQRELGLARSGLAKALGHTVVSRVAIVGSDPYLRDGSDVTLLFQVAAQSVFDGELAKHLETHKGAVAGVERSEVAYEGHTIVIHRDPTGAVRQHRVQAGDIAIVSNSLAATKRVLDAVDGRTPKLSDAEDLKYMLARDPGTHDAFGFVGDSFVAAVVGPQQKIQQARRMRAAAELAVPGYAAMLLGWLEGRAATTTDDLVRSKLLTKEELRHSDGSEITFEPGAPARSIYGRTDALVPRIDLPAVTRVTEGERAGYERFSREYQDYWRQFMDPIAVRMDIDDDEVTVDVRVLPLIEGTNYRDVEDIVGKQRIEVPVIDDGFHFVWAVGRDTRLRREIDQLAAGFSGKGDLGIGWLGEWVMVGALDRAALTDAVALMTTSIQKPLASDDDRRITDAAIARAVGKLPAFAVADVDSALGLVAALTALQTMGNKAAPGTVTWDVVEPHGAIEVVRVGIASSAPDEMRSFADSIALYYAQSGGAIAFALTRPTLEVVLDRLADAQTRPKAVVEGGTQFVVEGHARRDGGAWTALLWSLQEQALLGQEGARAHAEVILRADPATHGDAAKFASLARAYFGGVPVTPEGRSDYTLLPEGVSDPVHGSLVSPSYPTLPVAGTTPIGELMARIASLRASVSFDDEPTTATPAVRSLHTRFELALTGEPPD